MNTYVAFLRGINVGGNSLIKMDALRQALHARDLHEVRTYIQSGNVIFQSESKDKKHLAAEIEDCIRKSFSLDVAVATFTAEEWRQIIDAAPVWWGKDPDWKHNILIMVRPYDAAETVKNLGELKPEIEKLEAGNGAFYQSISKNGIGRGATGSKMASNPVYKQMTVRNYNTATKIAAMLQ